jgi:hypothetical protein
MRQAYRRWRKNNKKTASFTFQINESKMLFKGEAAKFQRLIRTRKEETWESFCTNDMNNRSSNITPLPSEKR